MPGTSHRRDALVTQGFPLVRRLWEGLQCASQQLAAPATADDYRRQAFGTESRSGYGAHSGFVRPSHGSAGAAHSGHPGVASRRSAAIALYQAMEMTFWLPQAEAALAQVV